MEKTSKILEDRFTLTNDFFEKFNNTPFEFKHYSFWVEAEITSIFTEIDIFFIDLAFFGIVSDLFKTNHVEKIHRQIESKNGRLILDNVHEKIK